MRGTDMAAYRRMVRANRAPMATETPHPYTTCGVCNYATPGKMGMYTCQLDDEKTLRSPQHQCHRKQGETADLAKAMVERIYAETKKTVAVYLHDVANDRSQIVERADD